MKLKLDSNSPAEDLLKDLLCPPSQEPKNRREQIIDKLEANGLGLDAVLPQLRENLYSSKPEVVKSAIDTLLKLHDALPKEGIREVPSINLVIQGTADQNLMGVLLPDRTVHPIPSN